MKPKPEARWPLPGEARALVTLAMICAHAGISPSHFVRSPDAPEAIDLGPRCLRYWTDEVDAWLESRRRRRPVTVVAAAAVAAPAPSPLLGHNNGPPLREEAGDPRVPTPAAQKKRRGRPPKLRPPQEAAE
jgi:hypothetical protein